MESEDGVGVTPIYENGIYAVIANTDNEGYKIVNIINGVTEGRTEKLPSAIDMADRTRDVLKRILDEKENETAE